MGERYYKDYEDYQNTAYFEDSDEEWGVQHRQTDENLERVRDHDPDDPYGLFWKMLIDCGATNTTFCNRNMVHGIREAEFPLHMFTNVGDRHIGEQAWIDRYPRASYFDEHGNANINSMSKMIEQGYRVVMDSDVENAFIVYCGDNETMRFVQRKGVYVFVDPNESDGNDESGAYETSLRARGGGPLTSNNQPSFSPYSQTKGYSANEVSMPTVRKNKEGFTPKQVRLVGLN